MTRTNKTSNLSSPSSMSSTTSEIEKPTHAIKSSGINGETFYYIS